MDILVSTLCDFAADYQGKLCIQGGFDSLVARQFPVVHPVWRRCPPHLPHP